MQKLNILIVDDDQDFAGSLGNLLSAEGHHIEKTFTGEDAISKFRDNDFDVTFMDVKLPGINGVESFFELKKINSDAKVIMMTAFSIEKLLQQAIEGGAVTTLHKPIELDEILDSLNKIQPKGIILVVDDDLDFTKTIGDLLRQEDFNVLVASDGKEAVDKVLANNIDILVLDLRLPIISGLDVYLQLEKLKKAIPTIIITGYPKEENKAVDQLLQKISVTGCLEKPFDLDDLLKSVEGLIADKQ